MLQSPDRWIVYRYPKAIIIIPIDDIKTHSKTDTCWCYPRIEYLYEDDFPTYIHHAVDLREYEEAAHQCFMDWLLN